MSAHWNLKERATPFARTLLWCLALWLPVAPATRADFTLNVSTTPSPVVVGSDISYTLTVSNESILIVTNVLVVSSFPESAQIVSATSGRGTITTNTGEVALSILVMTNAEVIPLVLELRPLETGSFTNLFVVEAFLAEPAETNVVTEVIAGQSDLGVSIEPPADPVFTGDVFRYTLISTNNGPDAAPDVLVTNQLPLDAVLLGVAPATQAWSQVDGTLQFPLGTLATQDVSRIDVSLQSTNAGTNTLMASISAPDILDTNSANNSVSTNLTLLEPDLGQLQVTSVSTQWFNPQTGLIEQSIVVSNGSPAAVESARVIVEGLSTNRLFNAVGTNNGDPFVVHGTLLDTNQTVELTLQYFVSSRELLTNLTFVPYGTPQVDLSAASGSPVAISLITILSNAFVSNRILLEFETVPGGRYQVEYADEVTFSNSLAAQPDVEATANRMQWFDYGPPNTIRSAPPARFYRVMQLP